MSGKGESVSSVLHTIRYPSGDTEFRTQEQSPVVGDSFQRNGDTWIVQHVERLRDGTVNVTVAAGSDTPTLEPAM